MANRIEKLVASVKERFAGDVGAVVVAKGEVTVEISAQAAKQIMLALRDEEPFSFEQLSDLCVVDYSQYGETPWAKARFAVVYHLLSIRHNRRLRVKIFVEDSSLPRVESVVDVWSCANWFEREAFDLFGVLFEGHPDLRRLLTDYGFVGHPFRKDFPIYGHVEVRYDPEKRRVVYEPVNIEPRTLVPRVIRHDNRYETKQQQAK